MDVDAQIEAYIAGQPAPKQEELQALHRLILRVSPETRLWFLDGRNEAGKIVSNPNIGYGHQVMTQAGGKSRDFYRIGLSANTTGLSLYIIGIADKAYLAQTWGERLGKASVTSYCIRFRTLSDIDMAVLEEVIRFGFQARNGAADRPAPAALRHGVRPANPGPQGRADGQD
jgi:hypothetical protein